MEDTPLKAPKVETMSVLSAPAQAEWDGALGACCGRCDTVGCQTCWLTYFCPCFTFGLNARKAFAKKALTAALTFFALLVLPGIALNAVVQPAQFRSLQCIHAVQAQLNQQARLQPQGITNQQATAFLHRLDQCQDMGWHRSPAFFWMLLMCFAASVLGLVYVTRHRLALRRKLGIKPCMCCGYPGGARAECCLLYSCLPCALCQERRTLIRYNVEDGVVHGEGRACCAARAAAPAATKDGYMAVPVV